MGRRATGAAIRPAGRRRGPLYSRRRYERVRLGRTRAQPVGYGRPPTSVRMGDPGGGASMSQDGGGDPMGAVAGHRVRRCATGTGGRCRRPYGAAPSGTASGGRARWPPAVGIASGAPPPPFFSFGSLGGACMPVVPRASDAEGGRRPAALWARRPEGGVSASCGGSGAAGAGGSMLHANVPGRPL